MTTVKAYDLAAIRRALPSLADVTYMNSGTEGIMAEPVLQAYFDVLGRFERYGYWVRRQIADKMPEARARLASVLNAAPEEVSVTRSGTDGVSIVLGSFPFQAGDQILIGSEEHPAITYPAFALQTTIGVEVRRFIFHHDPQKTLESFASQLTPRTRMAAFSHVSCETGIRMPVKQMIELAHQQGARVLVDGAQSVGMFPVDFRALGCDYLTGSVHKWLCGPKGTGVLAVRKDRLDELTPRYVGGGSLADGFPWTQLDHPESIRVQFAPATSRFEYGMLNPALYVGIIEAVNYLEGIGWEAIADHERAVVTLLKQRLAEIDGVTVQTPMAWENSSALVNFKVEGIPGRDLHSRLWNDWKIIQRAVRDPDGVRLSVGYFAGPEDVERIVEAVTTIRKSVTSS
ncbi:MAG TPA: aminotransferase class V-fold PLP-dependent enzyme [Chloroflexota bacterium]|nr:aminotransferase class V-fold PLP-dependent enzyme [Chloroflexota bacterium]